MSAPPARAAPSAEAVEPLAITVLRAAQKRCALKRRRYANPARIKDLGAVAESGAALILEALKGRS
jgi:hypothetical protein